MKKFILIIYCLASVFLLHGQQIDSITTSDSETLYFTSTGNGPKVILLSGGPGYDANSLMHWVDSLSNDFECILFDQRGTGLSKNVKLDSTTINLDRATQDIDDLRKHLGVEQLTLCGISWGGMLAQAYASYFPGNTKKIVLVSTLGPDLSLCDVFLVDNLKMRRYPEEKDSLLYWKKQPESELSKLKVSVFWLLPYFYDHSVGYKVLPDLLRSSKYYEQMSNLMWKDIFNSYDLKTVLKNYKGECIIIRPRQDPIPAESVYHIKEVLPQSRIITIERCGHMPGMEQPEKFYKILREVL